MTLQISFWSAAGPTPVTAECITVVSLLLTGWLLGGIASGFCAAVLYATYPLAVQQGMMYYPTAFQVASIAAAIALVVVAERADGNRRLGLSLAAGFCLGVGYLFKEDVAIVVAAVAVAAVVAGFPRLSSAFALCAGAALVFGAESIAYWTLTGSPTFRLTSTSGLGFASQDNLRIGSIYHWDAYLRSLWAVPVQVGIVWWLSIPALWAVLRERSRGTGGKGLVFIAAVFVLVFAYLQFGTGSFSSYAPLPKTPRYTALVTPILMLLVGAWIARLLHLRRRVGATVLTTAIAAAIPCIVFLAISSSERSRNTLALLPALDRFNNAALYTDYYGLRLIRVLDSDMPDIRMWYHAKFDTNQIFVNANPESGSLVLLDRQMAKIYTSSYEMTLPPSIDHPPATWSVVWQHRAYGEGSFPRRVLESARSVLARFPDLPLNKRIASSIAEIIEGDDATLYRVP